MRVLLSLILIFFSQPLYASTITKAFYSVGDELRVVDFDGANFVGTASILSPLVPDWTAMSYDASAGKIYYAIGDELRVVGFDGANFTGFASILSPLIPDWTAMSYDASAGKMYYAIGDELRVVGFDGANFVGAASILSPLIPDWTGMSLLIEPDSEVPLPAALPMFLAGLGGLGFAGRRKRRVEKQVGRAWPAARRGPLAQNSS